MVEWDPPFRVRYRWHLFFRPSEATDVEVTFSPQESGTLVRIEQSGWERLGEAGPPRRTKTQQVWGVLAVPYRAAAGPSS